MVKFTFELPVEVLDREIQNSWNTSVAQVGMESWVTNLK